MFLKRFELLLHLMDVLLIAAALVSLYHRNWAYGIFLVVMGQPVGMIAARLRHNRGRSGRDLANDPTRPKEFLGILPESQEPERLSADEGRELAGAVVKVGCVVALVICVTGFHFGMPWYITIPAATAGGWGFVLASFVLVLGMTWWRNRKAIRGMRKPAAENRSSADAPVEIRDEDIPF